MDLLKLIKNTTTLGRRSRLMSHISTQQVQFNKLVTINTNSRKYLQQIVTTLTKQSSKPYLLPV